MFWLLFNFRDDLILVDILTIYKSQKRLKFLFSYLNVNPRSTGFSTENGQYANPEVTEDIAPLFTVAN